MSESYKNEKYSLDSKVGSMLFTKPEGEFDSMSTGNSDGKSQKPSGSKAIKVKTTDQPHVSNMPTISKNFPGKKVDSDTGKMQSSKKGSPSKKSDVDDPKSSNRNLADNLSCSKQQKPSKDSKSKFHSNGFE